LLIGVPLFAVLLDLIGKGVFEYIKYLNSEKYNHKKKMGEIFK
jgi:hypothetical protein